MTSYLGPVAGFRLAANLKMTPIPYRTQWYMPPLIFFPNIRDHIFRRKGIDYIAVFVDTKYGIVMFTVRSNSQRDGEKIRYAPKQYDRYISSYKY